MMITETKLGRRIALKKKLEEEFRLAEERRNRYRVRRFQDTQQQSGVDHSEGEKSEVQDTITEASSDFELEKGKENSRKEAEKKQIVEELDRIIDKKDTICKILEDYKKKREDMVNRRLVENGEPDEVIIETEEKLLIIQQSINSLVEELNNF